ncbi:MAG: hypothetical protein ACJ74J_12325 [Blastocatellia bacterium]
MKFSKPINREVEIDGQDFIVSFDDSGIELRLKGKRKTARVEWAHLLDIARGEDGADARTMLGLSRSTSGHGSRQQPAFMAQHEDAMARTINPPAPQPQPDGNTQPPSTDVSSLNESSTESGSADKGRAVSAGEIGPES